MNNLQIFNNPKFGQVRTVNIDGKVNFVAIDIAKALGYKDPNSAVTRHCKGSVKHPVPTNSGQQNMNVIPEGDIYRLAAKSELPGADEFESWIFDEVLPQIRETGGYIPKNENDTDEDILAKAVLIAQKTIEKKNKIIEEKDKLIEEQKPQVLFAKAVETSDSSILVGELSKILKQNGVDIGQNRLFERLRNEGYLIKKKGESFNLPTQYSMDLKLFEIKKRAINNPDGSVRTTRTTKVTGKGQIYFVNKFKEEMACQN